MPSLRPATPDDVPSSNNNDNNNASSNKVRAVILTSDMKCQLRSIIPIKHQGGNNRGVSEGDILCKVKGFIAACRGLSTVQVLMLNFPNEIEIIRVGGTDRFCLREIPPKNYFADERSEKSIEMESYPAYNIDRKGESCANKPLVSCMKHKATNNTADVVVKKEPGKEEHLVPKDGYADYTTTKARDHLTYDSSAPLDHSLSSVSNNSSEHRVNKDIVRRDDSGKIPVLSDDMIANILSVLPSKDGKVRGTSISTIIENVQGFLDACNGKDFQQILEANLRGKIIIGSDSEGTKRYYTRDCLNANNISCSPSNSSTSCSRVQGYDTLQSSKKQLPNIVSITQDTTSASVSSGAANSSAQMKGRKGNSVEANIVKLLQEETKIKLSQFKQKYHTRFKKDLSHAGKLTNYLQQNPDVVLTEPVSGKGKGKHTNDCYVVLNRQIQSNTSTSNEKNTDATTNTARQIEREAKASDTILAASISTNDNGNTNQKQAVVPVTKANTPHKIQDMLKLTDDQAQTCTKFPPGSRVVYDYQGLSPSSNDGHTFAEMRIGKVISVSISLSSTTKGQLKHEIKLNKGSMMVDEGNLAYAPQCLVYYQLEEEQEAAVVLSCQKDNSNTWQYSILVSRLDGDGEIVSLMLQNVSIDQLTHRESSSVVHDTTKQYTDTSVGGGSQSRNSKKRPNNAENGNCGIDNKRTKTG